MYYWKTGRLAAGLRSGTLKESDFKGYYIASSVLMMVVYYLAMMAPPGNTMVTVVEAIGVIAITVFGLNHAFKVNGGNAGSGFVNKATALTLPLLLRITLCPGGRHCHRGCGGGCRLIAGGI